MPELSKAHTQIFSLWTALKTFALASGLTIRWEERSDDYFIWTQGLTQIYVATIWKGDVPWAIQEQSAGDYSQAQNDSDKIEFETTYKV